ncbi:amino acid ABC transporter substrate-binding protein [Waterburya agarophytonicola K14]|uniref:Amino acid ABC transporter substrate-binding protein n=1 Tax=Waterburya agarophytonicola KI4 TaxID=2874699 RepID=A0A964FHS6_9CYAN|nr:amino acid ABC transporter substrate-binding protein [Waterburya agarophytonicola]MCC0179322.1 amino acid ABC transporter substrate-binding protein [Waterburya agarophytonicola KI4]
MLQYLWAKTTAISVLSFGFLILPSPSAIAETVLEKIERTGKFTAGTSKDALPFAYRNEAGELVGYSIDILNLITEQLEIELDRDIELELVALQPKERIPELIDGDVDIVCDASSFTWKRDRLVDFSFSYSSTGTRLLAKKGNDFWDPASLAGKRVGAIAKTTNERSIRLAQPEAEMVIFKDRAAGYEALENGKIDAFASDGILLESWLNNSPNPQNYQIMGDYSHEGIACMVAENNSPLLNVVNYSLVDFMQGFLDDKPEYVAIFERWFGAQGILPLTQDLKSLMIDNMQLLIDFKDRIK